jgi:SAM-dependent methyltransferase
MMMSLIKRSCRRVFSATALARLAKWYEFFKKIRYKGKSWRRVYFRFSGHCKACGGKNVVRYTNPVVSKLYFSFYQCRDCDFIFVFPLPNLSATYEDGKVPELGEGQAVWNGHYLDSINQHTDRRGKLLEIGFGDASFLKLAQADGWEVYGTDVNETVVKHASEVLNLPNIGLGTLEKLGYSDSFFDVVAGFNFLEHVPEPRKTLEEIRRILHPLGVVVVMCPNIEGIYHLLMPEILGDNEPLKISWVPPAHLSYFNKANLKILLEGVGFDVIADESHLMSSLWCQFEVMIGPKVTAAKLKRLVSEIQSASSPRGDARVKEYRQQIKSLLVERMTWTMLSDLMEVEPALGAEVGILFLGRKRSG